MECESNLPAWKWIFVEMNIFFISMLKTCPKGGGPPLKFGLDDVEG